MPGRSDFSFADSEAARMLSSGLQRLSAQEGISMRELARRLNYKQAVVLSHMASGRVPIPVDRAVEFAEALKLDPRSFLLAVLRQRHPETDWRMLERGSGEAGATMLVTEFQNIAGRALEDLTPEQRRVMREVAADPHPARRWLSIHEVPAVDLLRGLRREMPLDGLSKQDRDAIKEALQAK